MLKIENKDNIAILEISGDIMSNSDKWLRKEYDFDLTIPNDVKEFFSKNPNKEVRVNINSNGGDVFSGTAISNMIKSHPGKTVAYIESIGASIASVIALSCDYVKMPSNSYLMIHKPFCTITGTADDLLDTATILDKIQNNIVDVYMTKALDGISKEYINELVNNETWLTGLEASKIFKVELLDDLKVLNCNTKIKYNNQPFFNNKKEIPGEILEEIEKLEKY